MIFDGPEYFEEWHSTYIRKKDGTLVRLQASGVLITNELKLKLIGKNGETIRIFNKTIWDEVTIHKSQILITVAQKRYSRGDSNG